jgi:hypothetical protein
MAANRKWTDQEEAKFIATVVELRKEDPEPSLLQICKLVNESMFPEEKQKSIIGINTIKGVYEKILIQFPKTVIPEPVVEEVKEIDLLRAEIQEFKKEIRAQVKRFRLKIGLSGLEANQFGFVNEAVKHVADVIYIERDQSRISVPRYLDYVIVTKFVSHSLTDVLKQYYPPEQLIRIEGGLNQIKERIFSLA